MSFITDFDLMNKLNEMRNACTLKCANEKFKQEKLNQENGVMQIEPLWWVWFFGKKIVRNIFRCRNKKIVVRKIKYNVGCR